MAKVKKRALSIALVLAMLLSLSVTAFAAQNDVSIELDGKKVAFTSESGKPFVDANGRTHEQHGHHHEGQHHRHRAHRQGLHYGQREERPYGHGGARAGRTHVSAHPRGAGGVRCECEVGQR